MTPFTYYLIHIPTNKKYYGARWAKNCHPSDLWTTYFTSSKHVKKLIKEYGINSFNFQIRKTFSSVEECRHWEQKVLRRLHVTQKDEWINKNINGNFLPYGKQTKEHVEKRINNMKKTKSSRNYICSDETKVKISKSSKGKSKPFTEKHKTSLRCHTNNKTFVNCPYCDKIGQLTNMKRWHFEHCKLNPKKTEDLKKYVTCTKCNHSAFTSPNFYRYHNDNCIYVHNAI